jgi:GAF domain
MRFKLLPDEAFAAHVRSLDSRILDAGDLVSAETFLDFADKAAIAVLERSFRAAGADEGTIWLADRTKEILVPVFNTGPQSEEILKQRQPVDRGIIGMVFSIQQAFCENEMSRNPAQDRTIGEVVGFEIESMIAVPLNFARECRGVVSCVIGAHCDKTDSEPRRFTAESLREVGLATYVVSSLFDYTLLATVLGWERS